jgi:hypothetical protein
MQLLQELFAISEAEVPGTGQVEITDLIKYFPNTHDKAIQKLWGGHRLSFNGRPFFGSSGNDDVESAMTHSIDQYISEDPGLVIPVGFEPVRFMNDDDSEEHWIDLNVEFRINKNDKQQVYVGFDPKRNQLLVGFDVWFNEQDFNDAWDEAFQKETGIDFDVDNEEHMKAFQAAHDEFKKKTVGHVLFRLDDNGSQFDVVNSFILGREPEYAGVGLFYEFKKSPEFKALKLIDLAND